MMENIGKKVGNGLMSAAVLAGLWVGAYSYDLPVTPERIANYPLFSESVVLERSNRDLDNPVIIHDTSLLRDTLTLYLTDSVSVNGLGSSDIVVERKRGSSDWCVTGLHPIRHDSSHFAYVNTGYDVSDFIDDAEQGFGLDIFLGEDCGF